MKRTKEKRGITLIALIITIIVLLILAGVTISMVVGDNGVLTQAQKAKIKTEKAKDEELRGLTAAEAGGNLEMTWYQDGDNTVPIPAYFAVSQVEGENKVDDGLVIIDSNGNEFVWIPCGTKTGETYNTKEYDDAKDYVKNKWNDKTDENYKSKTWINTDSSGNDNTETKKQSIEKYGGFYIARFEAGVPSNAPFYISNTSDGKYVGIDGKTKVYCNDSNNARGAESAKERVKNLKPVSKRNIQAWNFIDQPTAKIVSEKMYENNNTIDSYLVDSNAWNYICEHKLKNIIEESKLKEDSTQYGNYNNNNNNTDYTSLDCLWAKHKYDNGWNCAEKYEKGNITPNLVPKGDENKIELATGASDDFKVYNIYDMAGNMWEWTAETGTVDSGSNDDIFAVLRGGGFNQEGGAYSVYSMMSNYDNSYCEVNVCFRPVFYVK